MSQLPILPPFIPNRTRIANLVPFTYRDSMTMLEKIENLQKYVTEFVPEVNAAVDILVAEFEAINEAQLVEFDIRFTDFVDHINALVALINNKTGPVDVQHITLTKNVDTELIIDPLFPTNQPIIYVTTQSVDGVGGLTLPANVSGAVNVGSVSSEINIFWIVPVGGGNWHVVQKTGDSFVDLSRAVSRTGDVTAYIQNLLETGIDIYVPNGKTYSTKQLYITTDNQKIWGPGTLKLVDSQYTPILSTQDTTGVVISVNLDGNAAGNPLDSGSFNYQSIPRSSEQIGDIQGINATNLTVRECTITNSHAQPIVFTECTDSAIDSNRIVNNRREGIFLRAGSRCVISNNHIMSDGAIAYNWSAIATSGFDGGTGSHNHSVINNVCTNSSAACITVNTLNTHVSGNKVTKTLANTFTNGPGIRLGHDKETHRAHGSIVENNVIKGLNANSPFGGVGGNRGISLESGNNVVIKNNAVTECKIGVGVSVAENTGVKVVGNTIDTSDHGIVFTKASASVIQNNLIHSDTGIFFQGTASKIVGNVFECVTTGISVQYGNGAIVDMVVSNNTGYATTPYNIAGLPKSFSNNTGFNDSGKGRVIYGDAAPTVGVWRRGDIMYHTEPVTGGNAGWMCISGGTPGTWRPFGVLGLLNMTNHWTATQYFDSSMVHSGPQLAFFGSAPTTKRTAVPVTVEGVHAALVAYGLIT